MSRVDGALFILWHSIQPSDFRFDAFSHLVWLAVNHELFTGLAVYVGLGRQLPSIHRLLGFAIQIKGDLRYDPYEYSSQFTDARWGLRWLVRVHSGMNVLQFLRCPDLQPI